MSQRLEQQSLVGLEWQTLHAALIACALTPMGAADLREQPFLPGPAEVRALWQGVAAWRTVAQQGFAPPINGIDDLSPLTRRANKGEQLDARSLQHAGHALDAIYQVERALGRLDDASELLTQHAPDLHVDFEVRESLLHAFDPTGQLSAQAYPQLGSLRQTVQRIHEEVRGTLDTLVKGEQLGDVLQDRFWTVRNNRYVLPIKDHAKRSELGIVHGVSGSGRTVFVEPTAIIQLNNRLRLAEGELEAEEHRLLSALSKLLGTVHHEVSRAMSALRVLDSYAARAGFADQLDATQPQLSEQGVIRLVRARHPSLALRGVDVVPNDLALDATHAALVLTGPNTGGKTVALKTVGACALLVKAGCFLPAGPDSRFDWFDKVYASIGDNQAVADDLSSFSAQITGVRGMLDRAGPDCLILLDELATGTDPSQGAALAQAVLEALVDAGCRVVTTTHYARLKSLATVDPRFQVGAVAWRGDRPTYQLTLGITGESHAFPIARGLGLSEVLIARAEALIDPGERAFAEAISRLESERHAVQVEAEAQQDLREQLEAQRAALALQEARLAARAKTAAEREADGFKQRLREADKAVAAVVAALQADPEMRKAKAARATLDALAGLVPEPEPEPEPTEPIELVVGDRVRTKPQGHVGEIVGLAGRSALVQIGGATVRAKVSTLERLAPLKPVAPPPKPKLKPAAAKAPALDQAVRLPSLTLDLRGVRVEEGLTQAEAFFAEQIAQGQELVFVLHGHGTGAMKSGLRQWLRGQAGVLAYAPANHDQGGDAYTVVALGG